MILSFIVTYNTDTERFEIEESKDSGIYLEHSGSSYLRIKHKDLKYQLGTIGTYNPWFLDKEKSLTIPNEREDSERYLNFAISNKKQIDENPLKDDNGNIN